MKTADEQTIHRIVNDLSTNLIIEAGAGTGKTYALVSRVVAWSRTTRVCGTS